MNYLITDTLTDILSARENLAKLQAEFIQRHGQPVISFTQNIPGNIKRYELADLTFKEGKRRIMSVLKSKNLKINEITEGYSHTGYFLLISVTALASKVKKDMIVLEELDSISRIFDIDVIDENGKHLSRNLYGIDPRKCYICKGLAKECARSKKHPLPQLTKHINSLILDFCKNSFKEKIANMAVRALLHEVTVSPKPGLVDRFNNGAHKDMNIFTFINSAIALTPYFSEAITIGFSHKNDNFEHTFEKLRVRGCFAEEEMFAATDGVNTHKGLVFSMGILCCASAMVIVNKQELSPENITKTAQNLAKKALEKDLTFLNQIDSNGGEIYKLHKISGIRGEVLSGFQSVMKYALPCFQKMMMDGYNINDSAVITLLNIISKTEDTNIIHRSSVDTLREIQRELSEAIDSQTPYQLILTSAKLNEKWSNLNISAGGSADLLAITLFLHFITEISPCSYEHLVF